MPGILEEIRRDQNPKVTCRTCAYIKTLSEREQAEWDQAFASGFTITSIHRALQRRNSGVGKSSVEGHFYNKHRR